MHCQLYNFLKDFGTAIVAGIGFYYANSNISRSARKTIESQSIQKLQDAAPILHQAISEYGSPDGIKDHDLTRAFFSVTILLRRNNTLHTTYMNRVGEVINIVDNYKKTGNLLDAAEANQAVSPDAFHMQMGIFIGELDSLMARIIDEKVSLSEQI